MKLMRVGVDLAKSVFQVHGVDRSEKAAWRRKLSRAEWLKAVQETVPLEADVGWQLGSKRTIDFQKQPVVGVELAISRHVGLRH